MTRISSLCVFCGSKTGSRPAYREAARGLGAILAAHGIRLVYGGGGIGLMGVLADAVLEAGGEVTGVIPDFLMKYEIGNLAVSELIVTDSMHERKSRMFELADGFVVLPGGLGTLDESIEIITWKQLHLHAKPIVVVNVAGYWDALGALVDKVVADDFGHNAIRELYSVVDDVADVPAALAAAPEPRIEVLTSHL